MSAFDFTGDYPTPIDRDWEETEIFDGYDEKVDYLMNVKGFDRLEAERVALEILMDDAA